MDNVHQAGIKKKSFELNYNGGKIWCEHLDGLSTYEDEVIIKFDGDRRIFSKPSVSSFMIINLDETNITERIAEIITTGILENDKQFRKIAFVGTDPHWHMQLNTVNRKGIAVRFFSDYEEAKEWLYS